MGVDEARRWRISNLVILSLATAINRTAPPLTVLAGGLVGWELAPSRVWATLPVALVILLFFLIVYLHRNTTPQPVNQ